MLAWLLLLLAKVSCHPILPFTTVITDSVEIHGNVSLVEERANKANPTVLVDQLRFITLRENDWRDNHPKKMIFWSMESPYHRDFGKNYFKGSKLRTTGGSQLMSFLILGAVVGFIIYVYLAHVIMLRKLKRQSKTMELRKIVQRRALVLTDPGDYNKLIHTERRHSLINIFKDFKL